MPVVEKVLQKYHWPIIIALSLLVLLLRLPSLEHPFDNDSSAIAYHARLILHGEPLYSTHHPGHHLPAAYYLYALAFALFGDSLFAVKFLLMLSIIITVYLLYALGAMLIGRTAGLLAAIIYAILTAHVWMWGNSAEIEQFANLPRIAAFLVLLRLTKSYPLSSPTAANWKFIFVGLLSAIAFLFKAVYLSPLALTGFVLGLELWINRAQIGVWSTTVRRGVWVGLGFGITLLLVVGYFAALGLLSRLLFVFTLGLGYTDVSTGGTAGVLFYPIFGLAYNNVALLIFALAALIIIVINSSGDLLKILPQRHGDAEKNNKKPLWLWASVVKISQRWQLGSINKTYGAIALPALVIWLLLSFIEAGAFVRVFRFYYYLLIIPPLALLAGWFLLKIYHDLQPTHHRLAPFILTGLLTLTFTLSIVQNFNFYAHYIRYRLGQETYHDFLQYGSPFGPQLLQLQELADYIQQHTHPTDRVYYWSEDIQLYYLADRRCAIDIIWPLDVNATGLRERIFDPSTKYILVDTSRPGQDWTWLYPKLAPHYDLEKVVYGQEIYHRRSQDDDPSGLSDNINSFLFAASLRQ